MGKNELIGKSASAVTHYLKGDKTSMAEGFQMILDKLSNLRYNEGYKIGFMTGISKGRIEGAIGAIIAVCTIGGIVYVGNRKRKKCIQNG